MPYKDIKKKEKWFRDNSEKVKSQRREWYLNNKEKVHAQMRQKYIDRKQKNPELLRKHSRMSILKQYGLTIEDYEEMHRRQGHRCAICKIHQSKFTKQFNVDHCHKTGKVRGLLCLHCNSALGYMKDSYVVAEIMRSYLLKDGFDYLDNPNIK